MDGKAPWALRRIQGRSSDVECEHAALTRRTLDADLATLQLRQFPANEET